MDQFRLVQPIDGLSQRVVIAVSLASNRGFYARFKALEREVKELRKANEILKLASAFFSQAELDRRLKS